VVLSAEVRIDRQTLSGGGWLGTEYPILLRVQYRDLTGGRPTWYRGFFVENPANYPIRDGQAIPHGEWVSFGFNLLELVPAPRFLERIELVASGWSYDAAIRNVQLLAE